jgi:hypothetical protein
VDRVGILSLQSAGAGVTSWNTMIAASANVSGYGVDKVVRVGEAEHLLLFRANETSPAAKNSSDFCRRLSLCGDTRNKGAEAWAARFPELEFQDLQFERPIDCGLFGFMT